MKCRYLDEITGGRGTVFATGTPILNSMTELYTMQRYLQYNALQKKDLQHFDSWASTFGETVTAIDMALNLRVQIHKAPLQLFWMVLYAFLDVLLVSLGKTINRLHCMVIANNLIELLFSFFVHVYICWQTALKNGINAH